MPVSFVLDQHLRRVLWRAIRTYNSHGVDPIDAVRVGDPPDLPLGTTDPDLLLWAERENRILLTLDVNSIPIHYQQHLAAGHQCPGIMMIRANSSIRDVISFLAIAANATDPVDWQGRLEFIP